jgi:hypothetical protein
MIGLAEALFSTCAAIVVIVPRTASSSDWIGGDLASPFRRSVLFLSMMNVFRNTCFEDRRFTIISTASTVTSSSEDQVPRSNESTIAYYVLTSIESFGLCFLMLLMPYLLQCRLIEVINIRPGRNLMLWLRVILALYITATVLAWHDPNLWAFKRLGDALGCIPVIKTLQLFRRVYGSRGGSQLTIQTLEVLEMFSFVVTVAAAAEYLFDDHLQSRSQAIRVGSLFVSQTRVMFHGLLLNVMDEANHVPTPPPPQQPTDEMPGETSGLATPVRFS